MVSTYVGPDDWPGRWDATREAFSRGIDWENFRRDTTLMRGILTGSSHIPKYLKACGRIGVPSAVMADTRFGNPDGMVFEQDDDDEVFVTANSLRHAYSAWRIRMKWPKPLFAPKRLLEIGGGYGSMVRAISLAVDLPMMRVSLADAKPMIVLQTEFLRRCLPATIVEPLRPRVTFDLVTNVNSFGEMEPLEVLRYFDIIQERMDPGGVFYQVNRVQRVTNFARYPFDGGWTHVFVEPHLGDRHFVESMSIRTPKAESAHPVEMLR